MTDRRHASDLPAGTPARPGVSASPACESTRGEWGQRCPDCGQMLPARQQLSSWKAQRPIEAGFGRVTDRRWSPERWASQTGPRLPVFAAPTQTGRGVSSPRSVTAR